jgi:hypothetical protein
MDGGVGTLHTGYSLDRDGGMDSIKRKNKCVTDH